jgi:intracellular multiplication protein IcmC
MINPSSFDLSTMLANLEASFSNLQSLVVAISYVTGVALVVRGVMMYKIFGSQTMSSAQRGEFAGPLVFIIVGSLLIYLPSTFQGSIQTVFGHTELGQAKDLVAYQALEGGEKWQEISDIVVKYMKLIGLIAFVRGWIILSKMGHAGSQPGSIAKGIIHVIGGVLLINIVDTFNILATTFGYTGGS